MRNNSGNNNNNNNRGPRGGGTSGGGRSSRGGGGGGGRHHHQHRNVTNLPLEQGVVCTLKESFGFIHCADRPEEIFFHYSSVTSPHPDELRIDDEVEFRVGSSARDKDKLAAYEVKRLPPDQKIVWETPEGEEGQRFNGFVEKTVREDRRGGNPIPGTIRILIPKDTTKEEDDNNGENHDDDGDEGHKQKSIASGSQGEKKEAEPTVLSAMEGPLIHFTMRDYVATTDDSSNDPTWNRASAFRKAGSGPTPLVKGDLIECRMVRDRRTKELWAREIRLVQSEKERTRLEAEKEMLSNATLEHGIITSLKGEYGFLRSNKRREEVFFHYSNIHVDDGEADGSGGDGGGGGGAGDEDVVLKEGQDMQFLVVTEHEGGDGDQVEKSFTPSMRRRISARQVKLQPRGSVQFHHTLAQGVVGRLVIPPQPVDSTHNLESHGRIKLVEPFYKKDEEGNQKAVEEVFLSSKDSPGGSFAFRGGSSVGMWVQEGDKLLFDLEQDFVDGSCHAKPTRYLTPNPTPLELLEGGMEYPDLPLCDEDEEAVRLIDLAKQMRADGIVNAVRESYGFLHFSERPVDVHFKLFQVLPDNIQSDLRRNMGYPNPEKPLPLQVGTEASFDLSVHGTIHSGPMGVGGRSRGRSNPERENLKAQRILLLPKGSVTINITLATGIEALVTKEDTKQAYSGTVDLDEPVYPMTIEQRHPFVAKFVDDFIANDQVKSVVFHDVQTQKEDSTYIEMLELKAPGKTTWSYLPMAGETEHKGRLVLTKVDPEASPPEAIENDDKEESDEAEESEESRQQKKSLKKKPKEKITKSIHFDKGCLSPELKKDAPPAVGDKVVFDIVQSRKTGAISVANMKIVERHTPDIDECSDDEAIGIVTEVVPKRRFGFISVQDENASKRELLFFHLSSVESSGGNKKDGVPLRKGDEVKFKIGTEKNGKRVALNVTLLPKGTVPAKADKNACEGFVLLEPSHTPLQSGTTLRHTASTASNHSTESQSSRWDKSSEPEGGTKDPFAGEGCILLVSDPFGMFSSTSVKENGDNSSSDEGGKPHLSPALSYKNGALALHGNGSSSITDEKGPRRGDLVSFVQGRKSATSVRDIRIVKRGAATLLRGRLEQINITEDPKSPNGSGGSAKFIAASESDKVYDIDISDVVSCDPSVLKDKEPVEAIVHEGKLYGISRTTDLYLESKLGVSHKERPKLNLTVKKDRGGTIMAQSMMAKGPDGTNGFAPGWTIRVSHYDR